MIEALALLAAAVAPEAPPLAEKIRVTDHVWVVRTNTKIGNPSTVVSSGPDGMLIVDPNLAPAGEALRAVLKTIGSGPVRFLTATHFHGDHTEGFETFAGEGVGIVPEAQRERLATGEVVGGERPVRADALPALTFEKEVHLRFNGERVSIVTPPNPHGHTDGDAFVWFEGSKVLCVGDHLFWDKFPIVDLENGGDLEGYLANIEWALATFPADAMIVPGHGRFPPDPVAVATSADLRRNLEMLRRSIAIVRAKMASGASLEAIVEAGLPAEFDAYDAKPRYVSAKRWIETVYRYYEGR